MSIYIIFLDTHFFVLNGNYLPAFICCIICNNVIILSGSIF